MDIEGLANFETAAGAPATDPAFQPRKSYRAELIKRIQEGLAAQGFYLGIVDGQFGPRTEAAIRAYQASAELPIDGIPSQQLSVDLVTGGKVGKLLNRLEQARVESTEKAREALLSRPETRAL
ncbi:MAG: peptidoglycan-binding protein, partial [Sphingomonadales bacterium]|nr:peptidoglycan-binding protein [Sphingomonadales bacterium]